MAVVQNDLSAPAPVGVDLRVWAAAPPTPPASSPTNRIRRVDRGPDRHQDHRPTTWTNAPLMPRQRQWIRTTGAASLRGTLGSNRDALKHSLPSGASHKSAW